jgi:hypothetical protein
MCGMPQRFTKELFTILTDSELEIALRSWDQ